MGKAGIIAGKMLSGAAQVLVPAALADQAAKIQAKRDERLQQYARENRSADQQFTSSENALNREATAAGQTAQIDAANTRAENQLQFQRESFEASKPEQEARISLLSKQLEGAGYDNRLKKVAVEKGELDAEMLKTLNDPTIPQEQRDKTMELYLLNNRDQRSKVIVKQLRDDMGEYINEFAIFDDQTGARLDTDVASTMPRWAVQLGITDPADVAKAEGYKRQLEARDITPQEFDKRIDALLGN